MHRLLPGARRVMTRDEALALGNKLLGLLDEESVGVTIEHSARAITKVSSQSTTTDDGDRVRITFKSQFGSGIPVEITTNQLNDATLRHVIDRTHAMMPHKLSSSEWEPVDYSDLTPFTYNARDVTPVALWHESTAQAMETARGEAVPAMLERVHSAGLTGAATVGLMTRSILHLYRQGLTAFAEETDAEVTMTARIPDGKASGWNGEANRDWSKLTPTTVADRAIDFAKRSKGMVALEPGRRVAILGPAAVGQLVQAMAFAFDWLLTNSQDSPGTPFTFVTHKSTGRHTRFGMRVFDPRIMMVSDPADPMGGFSPFFESWGIEWDVLGFPTPAATWIDRGVLKQFATRVPEALDRNVPTCDQPHSVHLFPAPGTPTATVEEMIANCAEGVYVNRFSSVKVLDHPTGMMSGVTRDGCFLVKDGKISKPIKNLRFTDSPFYGLNKLEMIGTPERVAFGYQSSREQSDWRHWPALPVIVPPMMIQDFNFSALADAV